MQARNNWLNNGTDFLFLKYSMMCGLVDFLNIFPQHNWLSQQMFCSGKFKLIFYVRGIKTAHLKVNPCIWKEVLFIHTYLELTLAGFTSMSTCLRWLCQRIRRRRTVLLEEHSCVLSITAPLPPTAMGFQFCVCEVKHCAEGESTRRNLELKSKWVWKDDLLHLTVSCTKFSPPPTPRQLLLCASHGGN